MLYRCATHGDWDTNRASGCPECVRMLREENGRLVQAIQHALGNLDTTLLQKDKAKMGTWAAGHLDVAIRILRAAETDYVAVRANVAT